ncbi:MAG: hypothetical protein ACI8PZ_000902 [Myxococcota bacterium]|jgi:hypothetical protein
MVLLWAALAVAGTPELAEAVRAVEAFEQHSLPSVPNPTDRAAAAPWVMAMRALMDARDAADEAVVPALAGPPPDAAEARVLSARIATHLAELGAQADTHRLTDSDDDLPAALWRRAEQAWIEVLTAAAEDRWWGPAADTARGWILERDAALLVDVALPVSLVWSRPPCPPGDLESARNAHDPARWQTELALGCAALPDSPADALVVFESVVRAKPKHTTAWLGVAAAQRALGHSSAEALAAAQAVGARRPEVRWALAVDAADRGVDPTPYLEARWPRPWRADAEALSAALR